MLRPVHEDGYLHQTIDERFAARRTTNDRERSSMLPRGIAFIAAAALMIGDAAAKPYSEMFPGRTYETRRHKPSCKGWTISREQSR
jgi:hypothetical protein